MVSPKFLLDPAHGRRGEEANAFKTCNQRKSNFRHEINEEAQSYIKHQTGIDCIVEKIITRTRIHSSFMITVSRKFEDVLLDPNT